MWTADYDEDGIFSCLFVMFVSLFSHISLLVIYAESDMSGNVDPIIRLQN